MVNNPAEALEMLRYFTIRAYETLGMKDVDKMLKNYQQVVVKYNPTYPKSDSCECVERRNYYNSTEDKQVKSIIKILKLCEDMIKQNVCQFKCGINADIGGTRYFTLENNSIDGKLIITISLDSRDDNLYVMVSTMTSKENRKYDEG